MHVDSLNQWTVVVVVSYTFCTWQFLFRCLRQRIATHGCVGRQPCLQYFHVETKNESQSPKVACDGARQGGCFVFLRNYAFTKIISSLFISSLRAKSTLNQVSKVSTFHIIENVKNSKYRYRQSQVSNFSIIWSIEPALHIFHIFTSEDIYIDGFIYRFLHQIYTIKRKWHGGLKIWILSSRDENNILLIRYAHS